MKKYSNGFTVIELIFVGVVLAVASVVFFIQKRNLETITTDNTKKTAINAMYYSLEEVFHPTNGYYPRSISADNLKSVDPALFTDPNGAKFDTPDSAYKYLPTNCTDDKCKSYTLEASLDNEADFVKSSKK